MAFLFFLFRSCLWFDCSHSINFNQGKLVKNHSQRWTWFNIFILGRFRIRFPLNLLSVHDLCLRQYHWLLSWCNYACICRHFIFVYHHIQHYLYVKPTFNVFKWWQSSHHRKWGDWWFHFWFIGKWIDFFRFSKHFCTCQTLKQFVLFVIQQLCYK